MHVLHTDMKAISKNHNQSLVLVLFGSVWATRKRNYNQPMPRSRGAIVGTAVLSHTVPHNSIVHEEATQLWFPSLLGPTQAQRFCNCAPLINPSKPTLGDCRAVFATHAGGRHVVRKKNTYTQVHNNLSKCTPGETCVPVFHTKTCLLLPIRSCALKFVFQKINKSKNITKEKNLKKNYRLLKIRTFEWPTLLYASTPQICTVYREGKNKRVRKFNGQQDNSPEAGDKQQAKNS